MQTSVPPVPISQVVYRPGSDGREAFAVGHAYGSIASGTVFLRWTAENGWAVEGNAVDAATGQPAVVRLAGIDVTESGTVWGAPTVGGFVRRTAEGAWVATPPPPGSPRLGGIALGEDHEGVFGFAVGERGAIFRLEDGRWVSESLPSGNANVQPVFVDVVTVDRNRAIAVGTVGSPPRLEIRERQASGVWVPTPTGKPMFDQPPAPTEAAGEGGTVNRSARPTAAAYGAGALWISGVVQPVDPARIVGGGANRPFVLRYSDGTWTSFCPVQERAGEDDPVRICDAPLPPTVGSMNDIDTFGPHVVAGGTGLLRFRGGHWERLPSAVGTIQRVDFARDDEGFVTPKDSRGFERELNTGSPALGHWTRQPVPSAVTRWPHVGEEPLTGVALEPGGDVALAVGQNGAILRLDPAVGVERMTSPTRQHLHSVAWVRPGLAFAVGNAGVVLRFASNRWEIDPDAAALTDATLEAVAFGPSGTGLAVGSGGTILRYDGRWRLDPESGSLTQERVHAAAVLRDGTGLIAGDGPRTFFEQAPGGRWKRVLHGVATAEETVYSSLVPLADGGAIVAGNVGLLARRRPDGVWTTKGIGPLASPIHALAAGGDTVVAVPGASPSGVRIDGNGNVSEFWGSLLEGPGSWLDRSSWVKRSIDPGIDAPAAHDAILAVGLDETGRRGWAVGGFPSNVETFDGHRRGTQATASVWRVDLDTPPPPAPTVYEAALPQREGVAFAFLSDTACTGDVCGPSLGLGTRADRVLLAALDDIAGSAEAGGISFIGVGGDLRRNGIADDLAAMERLFDEMPVPVYGALGDEDLRPGVAAQPGAAAALDAAGEGDPTRSSAGYRRVFRDRPMPWGAGPTPRGIAPVSVSGAVAPRDGARTHYAFDVTGAAGRIRVAVVDTSQNLAFDGTTQNPPEKQETWLQALIAEARIDGLPVVVLGHEPAVAGHSPRSDAPGLTAALSTGASVFVTGGSDRRNLISSVGVDTSSFAFGAFGTGGASLRAESQPHRGAYHAWVKVTVDTSRSDALGRAPVSFDVFPVLESLALSVSGGRVHPAGQPVSVQAWGRMFEAGGANAQRSGDASEANATYVRLPFPRPCGPLERPGSGRVCRPADVAVPSHRFFTSDPEIAAFVARDPENPELPLRNAQGDLVADPVSGLLCVFAPGEVVVAAETGRHGARVPLRVTGGNGPCIPGSVVDRAVPDAEPARPGPEPQLASRQPETTLPPLQTSRLPEGAAVAAIAPPPLNPAPAPPAGGAGGRQEEHEAASERANFTARAPADSGVPGPEAFMLVILPAFAYALAGVSHRRAALRTAIAFQRERRRS